MGKSGCACMHARTCARARNQEDAPNTTFLPQKISKSGSACVHARTHVCTRAKSGRCFQYKKNYLRKFLSPDAHACTHARTCARAQNQEDASNTKNKKNIF